MISVIVLTKNEEQDLPGCLQSVSWCDDVHVLDSESTDATTRIAAELGARIWTRPFDNFASQRNYGLARPFDHPWVLILDADERVPAALAEEMRRFVSSPESAGIAAARMRRRDYLGSTWLRHVQASPFYIRLVRPSRVQYVRDVNERLLVDGPIRDLAEPFDHHPFSKGFHHWVHKHNVYSTMEADCALRSRRGEEPFSLSKALLARDFNERRYHQKEAFYRLPARPLVKFLLLYVFKRGFLDGRAGFRYAMLQSLYEYLIVLKTEELESRPRRSGDDEIIDGAARTAITPRGVEPPA